MSRQPAATPAAVLPPLIGFTIVILALYFARQIFIPLALAMLFTFLLTPVVKWAERIRVPRVPAVLIVLLVAFAILGGTGWVVTNQLVEIINELPRYRDNIHAKAISVRAPGSVSKLLASIEDLGKEFTTAPPAQPQAAPRRPARSARNTAATTDLNTTPQKVEVVQPAPNALQSLRDFAGPLIEPLGTAGLVLIFTIFMLIDREDLRNRLLRLIGQSRLHVTTKAMDDAARRVSRYLVLQFLVNTAYGGVIAFGLYLIGVPSSLLWGVIAMLMRFLPYVGPLIGGSLPFLLAVATTEGWRAPVLVFSLFLCAELITGNAIEPKVYGANTGLSAVAILVAAVFWTALWGPVGLILSTPLTVCLGVLGRHSPSLQFLDILLGDEPALSTDALFYQRLLALDQRDALAIVENYLRTKPVVDLYDNVIVPALATAEQDRHGGQLEGRRHHFIVQSIHEFITELAESPTRLPHRRSERVLVPEADKPSEIHKPNRIFCLAAHDAADEVTAAMLAQVADRVGFPALAFPFTDSAVELLAGVLPQPGDVICVSSVPPLALTRARTLAQSLHDAFPDIALLVGLWSYPETTSRTIERLQQSTGSIVITTMSDALKQIRAATAEHEISSIS